MCCFSYAVPFLKRIVIIIIICVSFQILSTKLPHCKENVCLAYGQDWSVYAVGSQAHVSFLDPRQPTHTIKSVSSRERGSGKRSVNFLKELMAQQQGSLNYFMKIIETMSQCCRGADRDSTMHKGLENKFSPHRFFWLNPSLKIYNMQQRTAQYIHERGSGSCWDSV